MSLENSSINYRIGLISWPVGFEEPTSSSHVYLNLGEIYDKEIRTNFDILMSLHNQLKYLYPFKIKKIDNDITIYNDEDFKYFRRQYKLTTRVHLYNYKPKSSDENDNKTERIVFKSPRLYNISCMKPLFSHHIPSMLQKNKISPDYRVFIVSPYDNPVMRGMIIDSCIATMNKKTPVFILVGDRYGKNKESTSTLMKRYLLSTGICSEQITKILCDKFPDFLSESLELLPLILNIGHYISHDIFVACKSTDMRKIMSYFRDNKISKDIKVRYISE